MFLGPVHSPVALHFTKWLVCDFSEHRLNQAPECFPKQWDLTDDKKFGNALRLRGRHHTTEYFSEVYDSKNIVAGAPQKIGDHLGSVIAESLKRLVYPLWHRRAWGCHCMGVCTLLVRMN